MCLEYIDPNSDRWLNLTDLPNEEWKDIKDFEGLYQVSNYGRVKSLERTRRLYSKEIYVPEIIRRNGCDMNGYQILPLNKDSKKYTKKIHRLVAESFISNPENKPCINHLNCNKNDNRVINLEWCTIKENNQYCCKVGHHYNPTLGKFRGDNPKSKKIVQKNKNDKIIKIWNCADDIADFLGVNRRTIGKCCRKEVKTVKGFILEYENYTN